MIDTPRSTSRTSRALVATAASAALAFGALAGAPAASAAQPANPDPVEAQVPYPLGGTHNVKFAAASLCGWNAEQNKHQSVEITTTDLDEPHPSENFGSSNAFPFNTMTIDWTNKTTGETGTEVRSNSGYMVHDYFETFGNGEVELKITLKRSVMPNVLGSSLPFLSGEHTETIVVPAINMDECK